MDDRFSGRTASPKKLLAYGFHETAEGFAYTADLLGGEFYTEVTVNGGVRTRTFERETGDEYTLHLVESAQGSFVSRVREAYFALLDEIAEKCFEGNAFRGSFARAAAEYVQRTYGVALEYPWEELDSAVWRRADTKKWFGVLMHLPRARFGLGEGEFDVLNVHLAPEKIDALADGTTFFRGYHMNKRHWLTVPLDGRVPLETLCPLIDESYLLATK